MSSDRTTRTNALNFSNGSASLLVDHWLTDSAFLSPSEEEIGTSVDHLMETLVLGTCSVMNRLNRTFQAKGLGEGDVSHVVTRSMTIDGVTMRVKVNLHVSRNMPVSILALEAEEILKATVPCMIHLLDSSLGNEDDPLDGMPPFLKDLIGGLPGDVSVMGFPLGDLFDGMTRR